MINIEIFTDNICYVEKPDTRFTNMRTLVKNIMGGEFILYETANPKWYVYFSYINKNYEYLQKDITSVDWFLKHNLFQNKLLYISYASKVVARYNNYLKEIPKRLRTYDICSIAISKDPSNIRWVNKNIDNYYNLVKEAFFKNKSIIGLLQIPRKYVEQLKIDFPEKCNTI
jgi:hypothetical protein